MERDDEQTARDGEPADRGKGAGWEAGSAFSLVTGGGLVAIEAAERPGGGDDAAPESIGSYRVVEKLGEGGMGAVYLARQTEPVERTVAVKVIRTALEGDRAQARFESERRVMALLAHENVGRMYEAGADAAGRPFFVMEHIEGSPITMYCDQRRLGIDERLRLFQAVCRGVQHAHQKGVIHRDLKPSNLLVTEVDGVPVPKIIDFGIAEAVEESAPAAVGRARDAPRTSLVGTPGYLSPEAVRGEAVDTRSDVYSLGVLLYELLTGVRPFDGEEASFLEVLRRIAEEDPPAPTRRWESLAEERRAAVAAERGLRSAGLRRRLQGDLDWIVGKAVARRAEERYGSATDLAADVARHLADEPVAAGPASRLYRLRKFARRRRGVVAAAALVLATLIAGLWLRTLEARRANREARTARQVTEFLVEMFELADPRSERGGALDAVQLLDRGAAGLERRLAGQPLVRAELMDTLGRLYGSVGQYERSAQLIRGALDVRRAELGERHAEVAASSASLARLLIREGDFGEAEAILRELVTRAERERWPDPPAHDLLRSLGLALTEQTREDEAIQVLERSLELQRRLEPRKPLAEAATLHLLAFCLREVGRLDEAVAMARRALDLRRDLLGDDHLLTAASHRGLAQIHSQVGAFEAAEENALRALAIEEATHGDDNPQLVDTISMIGWLNYDWGRYATAERFLRRALAIVEENRGVSPTIELSVLQGMGALAFAVEDWTLCEQWFVRAADVLGALEGQSPGRLAWNQNNLGVCRSMSGDYERAEASFRRSVELFEQAYGGDHPGIAAALGGWGEMCRRAGRHAEALERYERALAIHTARFGPDHFDAALYHKGLGDTYRELEQWPAAERSYRRALEIQQSALAPGARDLRLTREGLAEVLRATDREAEALRLAAPADADAVAEHGEVGS